MNLGELRASIERRSGSNLASTLTNDLVNEAVHAIATEFDWPWLTDTDTFTTSGATSYTLPTDASRIRSVNIAGSDLNYDNQSEIDNDSSADGWTVWGDVLVISPTPGSGSTVIVRYHKQEPTLAADGDTPLLPAQYHPAVVHYALQGVYEREDDAVRAEQARKAYETWLRRMRRGSGRKAGSRAVRVRPGAGI